jgi:hypothetical protein
MFGHKPERFASVVTKISGPASRVAIRPSCRFAKAPRGPLKAPQAIRAGPFDLNGVYLADTYADKLAVQQSAAPNRTSSR